MRTIENMNIKFGESSKAEYVIDDVRNGVEIDIDAACQMALDDFCAAANDDTGYTVSVWFD